MTDVMSAFHQFCFYRAINIVNRVGREPDRKFRTQGDYVAKMILIFDYMKLFNGVRVPE